MFRIVGVQRSPYPQIEFLLLQNQGGLRVQLKGHAVISEVAMALGEPCADLHLFADDVIIPPGVYVMLMTGSGTPVWCRSRDGSLIFKTFMGRENSVWEGYHGPIHVLATQHTYCERREPAVLV